MRTKEQIQKEQIQNLFSELSLSMQRIYFGYTNKEVNKIATETIELLEKQRQKLRLLERTKF
jgi:hypothetical protein